MKSYDSDSIEYYLLKKFHWLLMYDSSKVIENEAKYNKKLKIYINSDIDSYRQFASTILIKWFAEIVNSFSIVDSKRVSNGPIEGINSRVKSILKVANGFKNFSRMRNKIMYCLNKDSLITIVKTLQVIKQKGNPRGKYKK